MVPAAYGAHHSGGGAYNSIYGNIKETPRVKYSMSYPNSIIRVCEKDLRHDTFPGSPRSRIHPTQKPAALLQWLIRTYSNPGDNVLDPVSGSGTTAVAALACGRNVTCIEKDQSYFEASVERVRKHVKDNAINAEIEVRS